MKRGLYGVRRVVKGCIGCNRVLLGLYRGCCRVLYSLIHMKSAEFPTAYFHMDRDGMSPGAYTSCLTTAGYRASYRAFTTTETGRGGGFELLVYGLSIRHRKGFQNWYLDFCCETQCFT